jgi:hypothetical protein
MQKWCMLVQEKAICVIQCLLVRRNLYKTTDGGSNWQKLGLDSTEHISKIIVDPTDKKLVYVAAPGPLFKSSVHRGLYKSTDAGKTWEKILYINENTGCSDIAIHPTKSNIYLHLLGSLEESLFHLFQAVQVQLCINLMTVGNHGIKFLRDCLMEI